MTKCAQVQGMRENLAKNRNCIFFATIAKNQLNVRLQALKVENGALKAQNFLTASFKRL